MESYLVQPYSESSKFQSHIIIIREEDFEHFGDKFLAYLRLTHTQDAAQTVDFFLAEEELQTLRQEHPC